MMLTNAAAKAPTAKGDNGGNNEDGNSKVAGETCNAPLATGFSNFNAQPTLPVAAAPRLV